MKKHHVDVLITEEDVRSRIQELGKRNYTILSA